MTSRKNTYFIKSKTAKFIGAAFVLALTVSFIGLSLANHTSGTGTAVDTGWIDASAFVGSVESVCGVTVGNVWGQRGDQFSINNDGSVPAGSFTVDIRAHYGFYEADPQAPQTDETMRVSTSVDSRSIADLNGAGGSRPDRDDCGQMAANVGDYTNITGTPINYTSGPLTFAGLTGNSQSINILAVRVHGISTPPADPAVCSYLRATPSTIVAGGSSVLTWNVSNATSMSINNGVGGVALNDTGVTVHPTTDTTYTLTAVGTGGNATCSATVTVNTTPANPAVCSYLRATPSTIVAGGSSVLTWNVSNATSMSINNGVGGVALNDTGVTVHPTTDTTYTLTAVGTGGNATCSATVTVNSTPTNPAVSITKTVRNVSDSTGFSNSVNADPGETVEFKLVVSSTGQATANNVVVSDSLPSRLTATTATSFNLGNMSVGSQQTNLITATVASASSFGAGTTTLTNTAIVNSSNAGSDTDTAHVIVTITSPGTPVLTINKTVRNITEGQAIYSNSVSASPQDQVEFKIVVSNTGQASANNVSVTDVLPNNFSLSSGSLNNSLGNLSSGSSQTITLSATAAQAANFPIGSSTWTNTATATASNANTVSDTAIVIVNRNVEQGNAQLSITKEVRNVTQGVAFFSKSVTAQPNDQVEFRIKVRSTGQVAANSVHLIDVLPANFSLNFTQSSGGVLPSSSQTQFDLGNMPLNSEKTVSLFATAAQAANFPIGSSTWTNTATATAGNASTVSDTASVVVQREGGGGNPFLTINKEVRNPDNNFGFSNSTNADDNDRVEFRITVRNTGSSSSTATNVRVTDFLPSGLNFVSGTLRVDGSNQSGSILPSNIFLGSLSAGQSKTITFEARVAVNFNNTLTNTATAFSDNTSPVNDSASVFVSRVIGGNIDLVLSKSAFNQTQSRDATSITARAGDSIEYTLRVENRGNSTATNFVVEDNIADILELADLTTNSGATFDSSARVLRWSSTSINAGQTVERRFTVRIKNPIPTGTDLVMTNLYGNTVQVRLGTPPPINPPYQAPPTGPATTISLILSGLTAAGVFGIRKIRLVNSLKNN